MKTMIINKILNDKTKNEKYNDKSGNDGVGIIEEQKAAIEAEYSVKIKERVEYLYTVTLGYFLGVIQKNISSNICDNYNTIICEPSHLMEAIKNSKNYKKMIEEQEKSKNENKKIIKYSISSSMNKNKIAGGLSIPGFGFDKISIKENPISTNKYLTNNINDNNEINNIKNSQSNINNLNVINNNIISCKKNESLALFSKKNSVKDENNIIINDINNITNNSHNNENTNSFKLKLSPETIDKSEDKINETEKKQKKKSSDRELDAKDKLKNLNIEINSKKLEDQIRQLLLEKQIK